MAMIEEIVPGCGKKLQDPELELPLGEAFFR
jgi:hypothetical protein